MPFFLPPHSHTGGYGGGGLDWSRKLAKAAVKARAGEVWYGCALHAKLARASAEYRLNETAKTVDEVRKAADEAAARHS